MFSDRKWFWFWIFWNHLSPIWITPDIRHALLCSWKSKIETTFLCRSRTGIDFFSCRNNFFWLQHNYWRSKKTHFQLFLLGSFLFVWCFFGFFFRFRFWLFLYHFIFFCTWSEDVDFITNLCHITNSVYNTQPYIMISESVLSFTGIFGGLDIMESVIPQKWNITSLSIIWILCCEVDSTGKSITIDFLIAHNLMVSLKLSIELQDNNWRVFIWYDFWLFSWNYAIRSQIL